MSREPENAADRDWRERAVLFVFLAVIVALRIVFAIRYRVDSDETQHLHVVWAWTRGLLPYRDVFDNHAPLFHVLAAPLLRLVGERPEALLAMRLAMIPLFLGTLACVHVIAKRLFSRTVGLWAAVLAAAWFPFFLVTVEFRPDDLWMLLCLLAVAIAVGGRLTGRRCLAIGLVLGASVGVTVKSGMFIAALAGAGVFARVVARDRPARIGGDARRVALIAAGAAVVPLGIVAFFAIQGLWKPFLYGTIGHNLIQGIDASKAPWKRLVLPAAIPILVLVSARLKRAAKDRSVAGARMFVLATAVLYISTLLTLWPVMRRQDRLPLYPLAAVLLTPFLLEGAKRLRRALQLGVPRVGAAPFAVAASLATAGLAVAVVHGEPWRNRTRPAVAIIRQTLLLTRPDSVVMDLKGETVFRQRAFFYPLETITRARIERGLLPDTIPECVASTHTCVAATDSDSFPPLGRAFLNENFVRVGGVRVAGRILDLDRARSGAAIPCDVGVGARYVLVADGGPVTGTLDGSPYAGPRFLEAGHHEFRPDAGAGLSGRLAVVWADAVERDFSPFPRAGWEP